jgi:long-subunit acyl-CoA synthetase (AMP-forming)
MRSPTSSGTEGSAVIRALRRHARESPNAIAIDGERTLTWGELAAAVAATAADLDRIVASVVASRLDDDWRWVVLDLACLSAGHTALPLPRFFTPAQTTAALEAAGSDRLIVPAGETPTGIAGGRLARIPGLDLDVIATGIDPSSAPPPANTAKITFTSGSTGSPKGVRLSSALLDRVADALNLRLGRLGKGGHLQTLPLAVLLENVGGLYRCILAGGRYILPAAAKRAVTGSSTFDAGRLAAAVTLHEADLLITTPLMLEGMTASPHHDAFARLGFVAVGGAPLPGATLAAARAVGIRAYEGYGLSECGSVVTLNVPGDDRPGTVGRPLAHVLLDQRDGEVTVTGAAFRGYLGEPEHPHGPVATGDSGRIDADGRLVIVGRIGNRIVTSMGRNISPEWIESTLQAQWPGLPVCVLDDGEGLTAIVAGQQDAAAVDHALLQANHRLPDYAQLRARVITGEPFSADNDCLTANGRLRRRAIRQRFADTSRVLLDGALHAANATHDAMSRTEEPS